MKTAKCGLKAEEANGATTRGNISFNFLNEKLGADYGTNLRLIVDNVLPFEFALRPTFPDFGEGHQTFTSIAAGICRSHGMWQILLLRTTSKEACQ
jgi:hypothetical protein